MAVAVEINALMIFQTWEDCDIWCIWCYRNFDRRQYSAHCFWKSGSTEYKMIFYRINNEIFKK